jgi:hypothetical protein
MVRRLLEIADSDTPEGRCVAAFLLELHGADVAKVFHIKRMKDCGQETVDDMLGLIKLFVENGCTLPELALAAEFTALETTWSSRLGR